MATEFIVFAGLLLIDTSVLGLLGPLDNEFIGHFLGSLVRIALR